MTTDIVERLRDPVWQQEYNAALPTMRDAADEIERLRSLCENITHDNELLIRKIMEFEPQWKLER